MAVNPDKTIRIVVNLPRRLHAPLKAAAASEQRTMSSQVVHLVKEYLKNKEESPMKKQIDGTLKIDLLDDGDFVACEYEILSPNTMRLYGDYIPTDGEVQENKTLHVITDEDIDKENVFAAGWDEWILE